MIWFKLGSEDLRISWVHEAPNARENLPGFTACYIEDAHCRVVASGVANCHPQDRYSKEEGRKISLTRALAQWPREERRRAWAAYWGRKGQLRQELQTQLRNIIAYSEENAARIRELLGDAWERRN